MKNTTTAAISFPNILLEELDKLAIELNISRSALVTSGMSLLIKWKIQELERGCK